jgi:hypothetical protein
MIQASFVVVRIAQQFPIITTNDKSDAWVEHLGLNLAHEHGVHLKFYSDAT